MKFSPRPVIWLGDTRKSIRAFPKKVQQEIGGAIFIAQCGGNVRSGKTFKGFG